MRVRASVSADACALQLLAKDHGLAGSCWAQRFRIFVRVIRSSD